MKETGIVLLSRIGVLIADQCLTLVFRKLKLRAVYKKIVIQTKKTKCCNILTHFITTDSAHLISSRNWLLIVCQGQIGPQRHPEFLTRMRIPLIQESNTHLLPSKTIIIGSTAGHFDCLLMRFKQTYSACCEISLQNTVSSLVSDHSWCTENCGLSQEVIL